MSLKEISFVYCSSSNLLSFCEAMPRSTLATVLLIPMIEKKNKVNTIKIIFYYLKL
jgi:hypothetical protein